MSSVILDVDPNMAGKEDELLDHHYPMVEEFSPLALAASDSLALEVSSANHFRIVGNATPFIPYGGAPESAPPRDEDGDDDNDYSEDSSIYDGAAAAVKANKFPVLCAVVILAIATGIAAILAIHKVQKQKRIDELTVSSANEAVNTNGGPPDIIDFVEDQTVYADNDFIFSDSKPISNDEPSGDDNINNNGDGVCSQPTPYQQADGVTVCVTSDDCNAEGECCLTEFCICGTPNIFNNDYCVDSGAASAVEDTTIDTSRDILFSDPDACQHPTEYQEEVSSYTPCTSTGDCAIHLGECCVATYCFCKPPSLEIGEMCVPDT